MGEGDDAFGNPDLIVFALSCSSFPAMESQRLHSRSSHSSLPLTLSLSIMWPGIMPFLSTPLADSLPDSFLVSSLALHPTSHPFSVSLLPSLASVAREPQTRGGDVLQHRQSLRWRELDP